MRIRSILFVCVAVAVLAVDVHAERKVTVVTNLLDKDNVSLELEEDHSDYTTDPPTMYYSATWAEQEQTLYRTDGTVEGTLALGVLGDPDDVYPVGDGKWWIDAQAIEPEARQDGRVSQRRSYQLLQKWRKSAGERSAEHMESVAQRMKETSTDARDVEATLRTYTMTQYNGNEKVTEVQWENLSVSPWARRDETQDGKEAEQWYFFARTQDTEAWVQLKTDGTRGVTLCTLNDADCASNIETARIMQGRLWIVFTEDGEGLDDHDKLHFHSWALPNLDDHKLTTVDGWYDDYGRESQTFYVVKEIPEQDSMTFMAYRVEEDGTLTQVGSGELTPDELDGFYGNLEFISECTHPDTDAVYWMGFYGYLNSATLKYTAYPNLGEDTGGVQAMCIKDNLVFAKFDDRTQPEKGRTSDYRAMPYKMDWDTWAFSPLTLNTADHDAPTTEVHHVHMCDEDTGWYPFTYFNKLPLYCRFYASATWAEDELPRLEGIFLADVENNEVYPIVTKENMGVETAETFDVNDVEVMGDTIIVTTEDGVLLAVTDDDFDVGAGSMLGASLGLLLPVLAAILLLW